MKDDKKKYGRERHQVVVSEQYEVENIAIELHVTTQQVIDAIKKVGNERHKIILELKAK